MYFFWLTGVAEVVDLTHSGTGASASSRSARGAQTGASTAKTASKASTPAAPQTNSGVDEEEPESKLPPLSDLQRVHAKNLMTMLGRDQTFDAKGTLVNCMVYHPTTARVGRWPTESPELFGEGYLWDPSLFLPPGFKFPCPTCRTTDTKLNGYYDPRRVLCRDITTWLVSRKFLCHVCEKTHATQKAAKEDELATYTWRAHDPRFLGLLPPHVARLFGFTGLDKGNNSWLLQTALVHEIVTMRNCGMSFAACVALIREAHERRYAEELNRYMWLLSYLEKQPAPINSFGAGPAPRQKFPFPLQSVCPALVIPSVNTVINIVAMVYESRAVLQDRLMQLVVGRVRPLDDVDVCWLILTPPV